MLWVIFSFFLIIAYFLFTKLFIEIDSSLDLYKLGFGKVVVVNVYFINDSIQFELKVLWWKRTIDLNTSSDFNKKKMVIADRKNNGKLISLKKVFKKSSNVLKSFQIKKCFITIDTGNMPLNGILFPWFYLLTSYFKKDVSINFSGKIIVILRIENSIARMLWAYFKS